MIYLDHAATTPVPAEVARAVYDTLTAGWGNPSSQYPAGRQAKAAVDAARGTIADALGCKAEEFIFTSCGSESDNWAIRLAAHQNRRVGKHIITTAVEHSAVLNPCKALEQEGYSVTYLNPDKNGDVAVSQVEDALREDTALVTMMLVNNETGCIFPVGEVARLLKAKGSCALLHTDAVQGFLELPFRADTLARMAADKAYAEEKLLALDGVVRIGGGQAPHILSLSLVGYPSANVVSELGAQGICISAGSACHRGQPSHVYRAMGLDKKTAAGVLRISFGPETTEREIDVLAEALRAHRDTRFPML